jgi:hypothetical protein
MANNLNLYDPLFYAQEGLIQLQKALGMASRVHRGYDKEPQQKGSTIKINKPGTFTAQDAPSNDQDINAEGTEIKLDKWKEVKFGLTDKELNSTGEQIIADHIQPAAYAIADDIDMNLNALSKFVPWYYDVAATTEIKDLTRVKKILRDNKVPLNIPDSLFYEVGSEMEAGFAELFASTGYSGTSAEELQRTGVIGQKFGFNIFANQNVGTHTKGTASVAALLTNGAFVKGATVLNLDAAAVTGTLVKGDSFAIAGDPQRYVVVNDSPVTAASNAFTAVQIFPALSKDVADNTAVTVSLMNHVENLVYHRNAFALAMAPLSEMGREFNVKVETVFDEASGIALRARMWYDADRSKTKVALDALYGVKCLDPNLAVKARKAN